MNEVIKLLKKNKTVFNMCLWINVYINYLYYTIFMTIFSIFPLKKNRILFVSYYGKGYGDNGKYIANALINDTKKYEIIWAAKKKFKNSIPVEVKYVKYNSLKYLYYLSTSKVWINNARFIYGMRKRKKQYYIQTWHSSLRLKKIEKDTEDYLSKQYVLGAKWDSKMCDLIISGCGFSTQIYRKSFWYTGKVLETGTPRCDIFFNNHDEIKQKVYNYFNITNNMRIVLYAPTFREKNIMLNNFFQYNELVKKLREKDENYILLVRFHPNSNETLKNCEGVYNATDYPDMQELILAADTLITDYSGCCFDAMIAKKACILYIKDLKQYLKEERNLYFDFDSLPFIKVTDEEMLAKEITEFDYNKYYDRIKEFDKIILNKESGKAFQNIIKIIERMINDEEI